MSLGDFANDSCIKRSFPELWRTMNAVCRKFVALASGAAVWMSAAAAFAGDYTQEMFNKALSDNSTSPLYILISVPKYGRDDICISAPFLLGTIAMDRELAYDREGEKKQIELAKANFGKAFSFSSSKALANVKPRYGQDQLAAAVRFAGNLSDEEIVRQLRSADSPLHQLYARNPDPSRGTAYRDALACILLKRGILVGIQDRTGWLFVP